MPPKKRKRANSGTPKKTAPPTTKQKATPIDRLDEAEDILIQLLRHASETTKHLESALSEGDITTNGTDLTSIADYFTKTSKLNSILLQEYRKHANGLSTIEQSKRILTVLDDKLESTENNYFSWGWEGSYTVILYQV